MFFESYQLFTSIISFIIIYNAVMIFTRNFWVRNSIIFIGDLLILLMLVKEHTLIVLAVLSFIIYAGGWILQNKSSRGLLSLLLTLVLILFIIRNYPFVQNILTDTILSFSLAPILSVQWLGLSYILFRYIHWLVESYRRTIKKSNPLTFLNYIFFFPTILSGPIDTYNNYHYWLKNKRSRYLRSLFFAGITRIFLGAVKTLIIVPFIIDYATDYTLLLTDFPALLALLISLFFYSAYIYLDFSGYCDIAIGTAYLIGIRTPENFNNPYISASLSEFWKRWHITFSYFLKIYVFKPSIYMFNNIINPKHRLLVTVFAYLFTFFICGLWHGSTINFVYWGLWHGVGLSINKMWNVFVKPHLNFADLKVYKYTSILLTFVYVTIGWVFFHYNMDELYEIFKLL